MPEILDVIPVLVCKDLPGEHDFLVKAFGFEPGLVDRDGEGRPVHGEVRAGGMTFWLHRVTDEHRLAAPGDATRESGGFVVFVDDVDAHFRQARDFGARVLSEPVDQPYGQREYGAVDVEGHRWWFATRTGG